MRRPLAVLPWLLAACYGGGEPTSLDPATPQADIVAISGRVYDSLTGAPLAGMTLTIGGKVVETGPDGSYAVRVPSGELVVRIRFALYEEYRLDIPIATSSRIDLPLRRLHPAVLACAIATDSIRAVIVDLQGRKTINRAEGSTIRLASALGDTVVTAWDWTWYAVDEYTWRAAVPTGGRHVTGALFTLRDKRGFGEVADCGQLPAPPPLPDPNQPGPQ